MLLKESGAPSQKTNLIRIMELLSSIFSPLRELILSHDSSGGNAAGNSLIYSCLLVFFNMICVMVLLIAGKKLRINPYAFRTVAWIEALCIIIITHLHAYFLGYEFNRGNLLLAEERFATNGIPLLLINLSLSVILLKIIHLILNGNRSLDDTPPNRP